MTRTNRSPSALLLSALLAPSVALLPKAAEACGCFAPATPAQPVVQAGERIVFGRDGPNVVMHVQIQYQGDADDFGWLIPVPAVPEVRLGTEELFAFLERDTSPRFTLQRSFCGSSGGGFCSSDDADFASREGFGPDAGIDPNLPVAVEESSAGPYDYAVLRSNSVRVVQRWLDDNGYFVPANGEDALAPYLHEGGHILAVKLRAGESTGSLQPIVLEFPADRAMIPIRLTAIGAVENMGVLVWVLGEGRAIPRNFYDVEINEARVAWQSGASNYGQVVSQAVNEAPDGHGFVTELVEDAGRFAGVLDRPGRFGNRTSLAAITDPGAFVEALTSQGFPWPPVQAVLERHHPMPRAAVVAGVEREAYYRSLGGSLAEWDPEASFDPAAISAELWERVVEPTLEAGQLFRDHRTMTRLFTTLSPEEMTEDPVFDETSDSSRVSRDRTATLTCDEEDTLRLSWGLQYRADNARDMPFAKRISIVRADGTREVVTDNEGQIFARAYDGGGCQSAQRRAPTLLFMILLALAGNLLLRRSARARA